MPFSDMTWTEGMPEELKKIDHLGSSVYIGRYLGDDKLDPFYVDEFGRVAVCDPGLRFIHVVQIPGIRMTVVFSSSLSGDTSLVKKLVKALQSEADNVINAHPRVEAARISWKNAEKARTSRLPKEQLAQFDYASVREREYHRIRKEVGRTLPVVQKLLSRIENAKKRVLRMRDKAHQAFADFVSKFRYILIPKFNSDQSMMKKKKGGLSAWWRDKMGLFAHPRLRKIVEDRATKQGNSVIDPSEACSTMLCRCGTLHNQGMMLYFLY
jgi:hypothetical protein